MLVPGVGDQDKIENMKAFLKGDSNGFFDHSGSFVKMLQNGIFTQIYQREKELTSKLSRYYYDEKMIENMENYFKNSQKMTMLKKRRPKIFKNSKITEIYIDYENDSTKTLSDDDEGSDGENSRTQSRASSQSEKVINTTRKTDISMRSISKTQKNVVTLSKSSPEWIANYRAQEAERYRHPLKPWEYILSDGSKYKKFPNIHNKKIFKIF